MSNSRWKRLAPLTAILGAVVACGLLGTGTGTASAVPNGKHITYYSYYADAQCTTGKNENNKQDRVCTSLSTGSNLDPNHWWVGPVTIVWYRYDYNSTASSTCDVSKSQGSDSVFCSEPS
jgi:hypothetical protein